MFSENENRLTSNAGEAGRWIR